MNSRERIIHAASDLFFMKGYRQTTTKEIAEKASVSEALLFKYYRSKDGLIQAVLSDTLRGFQASSKDIVEAINTSDASPLEKLNRLVEERYTFLMEHFKEIAIIIREAQYDTFMKQSIQNLMTENIDPVIGDILKAWYAEQEKTYNPIALELVKCVIFDVIIQRTLFDRVLSYKEVQEQLHVIMKGLKYE